MICEEFDIGMWVYNRIQMEQGQRIPNLLERLDLTKFQLKELKHFDDYDHKNLYSTRSLAKTLEVAYTLTFNFDVLVTHMEIQLNSRERFAQLLEIGEIEASCLTNRGIFAPVIRTGNIPAPEGKNMIVPSIAITQTLKVSLLLKKQFTLLCGDVHFKKERSRTATEENVCKMVAHAVRAISVCGYHLNMNTSASELVPLLNVSQSFKQSKRLDQAAEVDILVSLSLISARRFVQASELLKKVSKFYVDKYVASKSSMQFSRVERSWLREEGKEWSQVSGASRSFAGGRVLEGGKYLLKAAKIELLLAEILNQPSLLSEKLEAYHRANSYAAGNISPARIGARVDYEETIYTIGASIMPFLLRMLGDKSEILKISSLKSIQFFYENLGCTLSGLMPAILRHLIAIYPQQKHREESPADQAHPDRSQPTSRNKLILDHINHLLESLLGLLPSMSKRFLKLLFDEIIATGTSEEHRNELRLYLLRFGEKILQVCGADLEIPVGYVRHVLAVSEGRFSSKEAAGRHISHNLTFFSQRILQLLKLRVLRHYPRPAPLAALCRWIHDTLVSACENEAFPANAHLAHLLDFIIAIYSHTALPLPSPVEPVIYLLNTSLHQTKLPFDKILDALIVLIAYGDRTETSCGLGGELIERIMARSKLSALGLKQLRILERVLEVERAVSVQWLEEFLDCIPHSNFDEIYSVFDLLVGKCVGGLDKRVVALIINTLFNQYTVKGKAHQHSKERLIAHLLAHPHLPFTLFLELCLIENPEAQPQNYYSRNTVKGEHCFDSKLFKLHSQLFLQKLNLLLLVLSKNDLISNKFQTVFTEDTLFKIHNCLKELLLKSSSFKVKSKVLVLIKQLIIIATALDSQQNWKQKLLLFKIVMQSLKIFLTQFKDSKLHYGAILNIGLAVDMIQAITVHPQANQNSSEESYIQFMSQDIREGLVIPENVREHAIEVSLDEVMIMWTPLTTLFLSPWENVREILMLVILNCFKHGLASLNSKLKLKITDSLKQLLFSFLQSNDSSERLMGVKLFAAALGLAREYKSKQELAEYIGSNWYFLRQFLELTVGLEGDWNEEISICSKLISKLCLRGEAKDALAKRVSLEKRGAPTLTDHSLYSLNFEQESATDRRNTSFTYLDNFLRADESFKLEEELEMPEITENIFREIILTYKSMLRVGYSRAESMGEKDSFAEDEEQQYFQANEERHSEKEEGSRSEEEQLEFEDLGIIELDDEEWGEEESEVRITQRLPLKKVYKLSPNLPSTKHHRIANKRYYHPDFEEDKLIVDELEGRINSPLLSQPPPQPPPHSHPLHHESPALNDPPEVQEVKGEGEEIGNMPQARAPGKKQKKGGKKRKSSVR